MDPLSIAASCAGLLTSISAFSRTVASFVQGVRGAHADLEALGREFDSLCTALNAVSIAVRNLGRGLLPKHRDQMYAILGNCQREVNGMQETILKYPQDSRRATVEWAIRGKDDVQRMRMALIGHRGALELGLQVIGFLQNSQQCRDIKKDTVYTRQEIDKVVSMLHANGIVAGDQRHRTMTLLDRFLEDLDTYPTKKLDSDALTVADSLPSRSSSLAGVEDKSMNAKVLDNHVMTRQPDTYSQNISLASAPYTNHTGPAPVFPSLDGNATSSQAHRLPLRPKQQPQNSATAQPPRSSRASISRQSISSSRRPNPQSQPTLQNPYNPTPTVTRSQPIPGSHANLSNHPQEYAQLQSSQRPGRNSRGKRRLPSTLSGIQSQTSFNTTERDSPVYSTCPSAIGSWVPAAPSGSFDTIASSIEDDHDHDHGHEIDDEENTDGSGREMEKKIEEKRKLRREEQNRRWYAGRRPLGGIEEGLNGEDDGVEGMEEMASSGAADEKEKMKGASLGESVEKGMSKTQPARSNGGVVSRGRRAWKMLSRGARNTMKGATQ